jgi:arylsulfatase A-like enzyme
MKRIRPAEALRRTGGNRISRSLLPKAILGVLLSFAPLPARADGPRPNVILILADDLGYGDLGAQGNPRLQTPNLDRLRAQSVRFTDHHVAPMCTPSRSELLTGLSAFRNGASAVAYGRSIPRRELPLMPGIFRDNGYATAHFGKWHLGDNFPFRPQDRGFDFTIHGNGFGISSFADHWLNDTVDDHYWRNDTLVKFNGYNTTVFFDEAMQWMRGQTGPFFVYLAPTASHEPFYVDPKYVKPYEDLPAALAAFYGMTAQLDEQIGRLLEYLEQSQRGRDTIVIYMTDNGTVERTGFFPAGMRGRKGSLYEGGHRVPFFVRWSAGLPGLPRDIGVLTHGTDLLPTLIELCRLKTEHPEAFDGRSLAPLLTGPAGTLADRKLVIQYGAELTDWDSVVLWNKWRLVKGGELYDLTTDPMQAHDLAMTRPDILAELRTHYATWLAATKPMAGRPNHIVVGTPRESPTVLTAADWIGPYCGEWGELKESAQPKFGAWDIEAGVTGNYAVRLYFFPPESGRRLNESFRAAPARPVAGAGLRLDDREFTVQTSPDATNARFEVRLHQGERRRIEGRLLDAAGRPLWGAIYVTLERVGD